jgi:Protein of unknown function, DUF547
MIPALSFAYRLAAIFGFMWWLGHGGGTPRATAAEFDQTHAAYGRVLKAHVSRGLVDYSSLKSHPEHLNEYLTGLAAVAKAEFLGWERDDQIAFLCNAYNAYTLRLIVENYPVQSIRDIGGFMRGPWDRPIAKVFGTAHTLNDLEHRMLRRDYAEPRVHFALVCAAKGCPPLREEPYVGGRLGEQLAAQARAFLADPDKNRVDPASRTVYLSPIFKWYDSDFQNGADSVLVMLKPYWPAEAKVGEIDEFKIRYTDYDWNLNDAPIPRLQVH